MPTVAIVLGIAVIFYLDDHDPPHMHLRGTDFRAKMSLHDFALIEVRGRMRPREISVIRAWAQAHEEAL